jgi:biopolymer transport protein ExbD
MAGIDVGGGGGGRKETNSEINMVPFIDLLMVTIAFLLITAVWSHMARLNADAQVPGPPRPDQEEEKTEPEKQLHVDMHFPEKFVLTWKQGGTVVSTVDVPRREDVQQTGSRRVVKYPDLAAKIEQEWQTVGQHRDPSDRKLDQAILHSDNETPYSNIIGVIDAVYKAKRNYNMGRKVEKVPAFNVTFSVN